MIVLVCGGRDFESYAAMAEVLDELHGGNLITKIVHGAAKGADKLAGVWAKNRGVLCKAYPADWSTHGRAAGPRRNQLMLDEEQPDLVVAFPGGSGTRDMTNRARRQGFKLVVVPKSTG